MSCEKRSDANRPAAARTGGPLAFRMKMASDPRLLPVVRSTVAELASVWGFEDEQCRCITLAVDEALSNVMRHAYQNRCDQEIELNCQAHSNCLEFSFVDRGEAPDPSRFCAQPLDDAALGGRGTHLIREIMDEVLYERLPGANRLSLKKYLPGAKSKG
ncbi:MAG TPA: ATP-binding protein [Terriglobia bacterium]|nr:ATP-binding protein [Terriglobia bacterium]